jgi:hypothetical protein
MKQGNAKDFAEADRIRDELLDMDVILEDRDNKTTWKTEIVTKERLYIFDTYLKRWGSNSWC